MFKKDMKVCAALVMSFAAMLSCASAKAKKGAEINPENAVRELNPLVQTAKKPGEGVYYSLFVRSFADGDGDGIGDFKGLIKKLDYLNDGNDATTSDLGVTGLWLLPIFPSPSYHGYDVDDYMAINPDYGTMADFEKFIAECNKRGIQVIIDITCNHSSMYNPWFLSSKDPSDPHRSWYRWITDDDGTEKGGAYNLNAKLWGHKIYNIDLGNPTTNKKGEEVYSYYCGLFGPNMPDFNMDSQECRDAFKQVFKFWLDKGVSGFRFDAAGHIYNSIEVMPGSETLTKAQDFWKEMNDYILSVKPDAYSVAEVWEPSATRAKFYAGMQSNFHFDMGGLIATIINNQETNDLKKIPEDTDKSTYNGFARSLESEYASYASNNPKYIDAPFLSNHDLPRSSSTLRNKTEKMKLAADMYILAEGVPFVYYGEEIAMKSGSDDVTKRTAMVWAPEGKDKLTTSWFNSGAYGNPNVYNKKTVSVKEQEKDPASLLNHYKRVIRVKTAHPALYKGRLKAVPTDSGVLESWVMECDEEKAFVVHNVSSVKEVTVDLPEGCDMPLVYAANPQAKVEGGKLTIPALSSVVLAKMK